MKQRKENWEIQRNNFEVNGPSLWGFMHIPDFMSMRYMDVHKMNQLPKVAPFLISFWDEMQKG